MMTVINAAATTEQSDRGQATELLDDELDTVIGGGAVSDAMKSIGNGLQTAARGGAEAPSITIFGFVIPVA